MSDLWSDPQGTPKRKKITNESDNCSILHTKQTRAAKLEDDDFPFELKCKVPARDAHSLHCGMLHAARTQLALPYAAYAP